MCRYMSLAVVIICDNNKNKISHNNKKGKKYVYKWRNIYGKVNK